MSIKYHGNRAEQHSPYRSYLYAVWIQVDEAIPLKWRQAGQLAIEIVWKLYVHLLLEIRVIYLAITHKLLYHRSPDSIITIHRNTPSDR